MISYDDCTYSWSLHACWRHVGNMSSIDKSIMEFWKIVSCYDIDIWRLCICGTYHGMTCRRIQIFNFYCFVLFQEECITWTKEKKVQSMLRSTYFCTKDWHLALFRFFPTCHRHVEMCLLFRLFSACCNFWHFHLHLQEQRMSSCLKFCLCEA